MYMELQELKDSAHELIKKITDTTITVIIYWFIHEFQVHNTFDTLFCKMDILLAATLLALRYRDVH